MKNINVNVKIDTFASENTTFKDSMSNSYANAERKERFASKTAAFKDGMRNIYVNAVKEIFASESTEFKDELKHVKKKGSDSFCIICDVKIYKIKQHYESRVHKLKLQIFNNLDGKASIVADKTYTKEDRENEVKHVKQSWRSASGRARALRMSRDSPKRMELPLRRSLSPVRREKSPVRRRRKSPVRRRRKSPVRRRNSPVRRKESAVRRRKSPVRRMVSPVRKRRSPVRKRELPMRRKELPVRSSESPVGITRSSSRDRSPLSKRSCSPRDRLHIKETSSQEMYLPTVMRVSPVRKREVPQRRKELPVRRRESPVGITRSSSRDRSPLSERSCSPRDRLHIKETSSQEMYLPTVKRVSPVRKQELPQRTKELTVRRESPVRITSSSSRDVSPLSKRPCSPRDWLHIKETSLQERQKPRHNPETTHSEKVSSCSVYSLNDIFTKLTGMCGKLGAWSTFAEATFQLALDVGPSNAKIIEVIRNNDYITLLNKIMQKYQCLKMSASSIQIREQMEGGEALVKYVINFLKSSPESASSKYSEYSSGKTTMMDVKAASDFVKIGSGKYSLNYICGNIYDICNQLGTLGKCMRKILDKGKEYKSDKKLWDWVSNTNTLILLNILKEKVCDLKENAIGQENIERYKHTEHLLEELMKQSKIESDQKMMKSTEFVSQISSSTNVEFPLTPQQSHSAYSKPLGCSRPSDSQKTTISHSLTSQLNQPAHTIEVKEKMLHGLDVLHLVKCTKGKDATGIKLFIQNSLDNVGKIIDEEKFSEIFCAVAMEHLNTYLAFSNEPESSQILSSGSSANLSDIKGPNNVSNDKLIATEKLNTNSNSSKYFMNMVNTEPYGGPSSYSDWELGLDEVWELEANTNFRYRNPTNRHISSQRESEMDYNDHSDVRDGQVGSYWRQINFPNSPSIHGRNPDPPSISESNFLVGNPGTGSSVPRDYSRFQTNQSRSDTCEHSSVTQRSNDRIEIITLD